MQDGSLLLSLMLTENDHDVNENVFFTVTYIHSKSEQINSSNFGSERGTKTK